ncbi:MAG: protein-L-isoaspartate(D-aspartate) O-methyltransferase [Gammaproteobacteria bacterium]|nr:protein-L-isoaspartate(D-aspartate) O-methyltransferase [Gammaproteobacteria bacterium]NIR98139.1 protein-L-isoaspartate(D-aspartate) O-methyltransferase [Gammaproteobacteria bacterium]NIT62526.1 protein-L-isoaspartate(D-aspartate) O-methyltransferase [Gammaproteobacteria bacterium]NIV20783.1 protein-L-isoaspartate(D-aspartate) O-methyltransferase [Gammaproteobacteria bacterium]NIY31106.1 protein-L-isoaspartate(D-aspartate) O-methyltransferase [Gammaproteobacteria bacterium]
MDQLQRMIRDIQSEMQLTRGSTGRGALDPRVLAALESVPREEFVPEEQRAHAYDNGPLPIGYGQTISQPYIVALMTDLLRPDSGDTVLEVGAGCGYQTAVLSRLVSKVYSVEQVPELAEQATRRLRRMGYDNVEVRCADGYYGWPEHAPYDGIVVTAAAPHVPQPLVDQLRAGARMVIPVGGVLFSQELAVVEKIDQGEARRSNVLGVAFVPLTGKGHNRPAALAPP